MHFAPAEVVGGLDDRGDVLPARTSAKGRAADDGRSGSCDPAGSLRSANPTPTVRANPPPSKADPGLDAPRRFALELERGDPAVVGRILALLSDGPMKPVALREAVGIKSRIRFNRYCLAPMLEKGLVVRTDPQHPNSPHQEYEWI